MEKGDACYYKNSEIKFTDVSDKTDALIFSMLDLDYGPHGGGYVDYKGDGKNASGALGH